MNCNILLIRILSLISFLFTIHLLPAQEVGTESYCTNNLDSVLFYCYSRSIYTDWNTEDDIIRKTTDSKLIIKDKNDLDSLCYVLQDLRNVKRLTKHKDELDVRMVIVFYLKNHEPLVLGFGKTKFYSINHLDIYYYNDFSALMNSMKKYIDADYDWYEATDEEKKQAKRNRLDRIYGWMKP